MIQQAGVYKIILYENKGVEIKYRPDGRIKTISNTGEVITIENSDCDTIEIEFKIDQKRSGNNKSLYRYAINWKLLGLSNDNIEIVNKIKSSIYKWVAVVEYYSNISNAILNPFKFIDSSIDNNISNHYNIAIENTIFGESSIDYVPVLGYLFEDGVGYLFEDGNKYIFE